MSLKSSVFLELARPVGLIYCLQAKQLESAVERGMFEDCSYVCGLTDGILRSFLEKYPTESATVFTQNKPSRMVKSFLEVDMTMETVRGRMELLFHGV